MARLSGMTDTVLIVDDHPSFRASARTLLESEGFKVVGEANDGASAVSEVRRLCPSFVLLDVQLPDMNGFDVTRLLCNCNGAAPVVVLTSSRDARDFGPLVEQCGARGFIPKADLSGETLRALLPEA